MACTIVNEIIQKELRSIVQNRPCTVAQETLVERVRIVIPRIQGEPRAAHGPNAPLVTINRFGIPPQVCVVMNDETASAIVVLRDLRSRTTRRRADHVDEVNQGQYSFP